MNKSVFVITIGIYFSNVNVELFMNKPIPYTLRNNNTHFLLSTCFSGNSGKLKNNAWTIIALCDNCGAQSFTEECLYKKLKHSSLDCDTTKSTT